MLLSVKVESNCNWIIIQISENARQKIKPKLNENNVRDFKEAFCREVFHGLKPGIEKLQIRFDPLYNKLSWEIAVSLMSPVRCIR